MNPASARRHLSDFLAHAERHWLADNAIGLEKESLRVRPDGGISLAPHPQRLGSALTHPYITTDFSEALLELITPPGRAGPALEFLDELHRFVYPELGEEYLWAASMPCVLQGEDSIPIAWYGPSARGLMKHIYRVGLGHRYGRMMQVIAGVHYNFSLGEAAWDALHRLEGAGAGRQDFVSERYLGLVRNIQRIGWLVPYLFGASPAVCASFFKGRTTRLPHFDANTLFEPFATSLRMGDIGYTNAKEGETGIKANYDSLAAYIESLECAINTPCDRYARIGVKVDGHYRQLNDHLLQIENEYYSTIRPKPVPDGDERPTRALRRRGVRYVELRSLDLDVFEPLGVGTEQIRFLEALMLLCLFSDSPRIDADERKAIDANLAWVAHRGREPGLELLHHGQLRPLAGWGREILESMRDFCELLDGVHASDAYCRTLERQLAKIEDPELTPSARVLSEMKSRGESFHEFARHYSLAHRAYFLSRPLPEARQRFFEKLGADSLEAQRAIEAADDGDLESYLQAYYA